MYDFSVVFLINWVIPFFFEMHEHHTCSKVKPLARIFVCYFVNVYVI
jgi:hypothetical protein